MDGDDGECCGEKLGFLRKAKEGALYTIYESD